jgi:prefoldin subunit 2
MAQQAGDNSNPELIIQTYKQMNNECQQLTSKVTELALERDEHKLVIETLSKLEPERKTFRLIGGVLVERTCEEVLPSVQENYDGIIKLIDVVESTLKSKHEARTKYKNEHGIMTQEEREARQKAASKEKMRNDNQE